MSPVKPDTATTPVSRLLVSRPLSAPRIPFITESIRCAPAAINSGVCSANPLINPIANISNESTILGVYSAKADNDSDMSLRKLFANSGAYSPRTAASCTIPFPIISAISGMSPKTPVVIIPRLATNAVAPVAALADRIENPVAMAVNPIPMPRVDTANKANAPANPRSVGTNGFKTNPATPNTAKVDPKVTSALTMVFISVLPKDSSTGMKIRSAATVTNSAAAPFLDPFIAFSPIANSSNDVPMTVRPLPIAGQLIPPKDFIVGISIASAADIKII